MGKRDSTDAEAGARFNKIALYLHRYAREGFVSILPKCLQGNILYVKHPRKFLSPQGSNVIESTTIIFIYGLTSCKNED